MNANERFLLEWLSKEDTSAYGECKGPSLNNLIAFGLAEVTTVDARGQDYNGVSLTERGHEALRTSKDAPPAQAVENEGRQ